MSYIIPLLFFSICAIAVAIALTRYYPLILALLPNRARHILQSIPENRFVRSVAEKASGVVSHLDLSIKVPRVALLSLGTSKEADECKPYVKSSEETNITLLDEMTQLGRYSPPSSPKPDDTSLVKTTKHKHKQLPGLWLKEYEKEKRGGVRMGCSPSADTAGVEFFRRLGIVKLDNSPQTIAYTSFRSRPKPSEQKAETKKTV